METIAIKITGLNCEYCVKRARRRLRKIKGVLGDTVKLNPEGDAIFKTTRFVSREELERALEGTTYGITYKQNVPSEALKSWQLKIGMR